MKIDLQPRQRVLDHCALFAKGEANKIVWLAFLEEWAQRNERDTDLAHQPFAELKIALVRQPANVGGEEIGAFAGQRLETEFLDTGAQYIAIGLQRFGQVEREESISCSSA